MTRDADAARVSDYITLDRQTGHSPGVELIGGWTLGGADSF